MKSNIIYTSSALNCRYDGGCVAREMWSLFNISDTKTLTLNDLERGVTTVTQVCLRKLT